MKMMRREAELKTELMQFMRIATDGYQTYPEEKFLNDDSLNTGSHTGSHIYPPAITPDRQSGVFMCGK